MDDDVSCFLQAGADCVLGKVCHALSHDMSVSIR
jgi:hypothetical protein